MCVLQDCLVCCAGARNDINKAKASRFVHELNNGDFFPDYEYHLVDAHGVSQPHTRVYIICDNGFPPWRCFQFPIKHTSDLWELRWSKRLESLRKGSECRFGVDEKVFRILHNGFPWSDRMKCGKVFKLVAVLTNMNLRYDRFHTVGECEAHWVRANTALDTHRISIQGGNSHSFQHYVDPLYSGGGEGELPSHEHVTLRTALITHYKNAWRHGVYWMRPKRDVVGVGARQKDTRPFEVANTPHLFRNHQVHTLASLCDQSVYHDYMNLDTLIANHINPPPMDDEDEDD